MKNGKPCCSQRWNDCPEMRKRFGQVSRKTDPRFVAAQSRYREKCRIEKQTRIDDYHKHPKKCANPSCGRPIEYQNKAERIYCSHSCRAKVVNSRRVFSKERRAQWGAKTSAALRAYDIAHPGERICHIIAKGGNLPKSCKLYWWNCKVCGKLWITSRPTRKTCKNSVCSRKYLSMRQKQIVAAGRKQGGGRCFHMWYTSPSAGRIHIQGSYELVFCRWADKNRIVFSRNKEGFPYFRPNGRLAHYYPDFKLTPTWYVETKGFETETDHEKWKAFPHTLTILKQNQIRKINTLSLEDLKRFIWSRSAIV